MIKGTFVQTKQGFSAAYSMLLEEQEYAIAEIPKDQVHAELFFNIGLNNAHYVMRHTSCSELKKQGKDVYSSCIPYNIFLKEERCGYIYNRRTAGFFKGYVYKQIEFCGKEYAVYTVCIPKEGTKYAIYRLEGNEQERQVALIEKPEVVYNRLDEYAWMALHEEDVPVVGLYILYIDFMQNASRRHEIVSESKEISRGKTLNKALLAKYDASFKSRNFVG